jgi:hypothetical protein
LGKSWEEFDGVEFPSRPSGLDTWREKTKRFLRIILKTGNDNAIWISMSKSTEKGERDEKGTVDCGSTPVAGVLVMARRLL